MIPVISYKNLAIVYHLAQLGQDVARRLSALEAYCWVGIFVPDEILHLLCMKGVGFTVDRIQSAHGSPLGAQLIGSNSRQPREVHATGSKLPLAVLFVAQMHRELAECCSGPPSYCSRSAEARCAASQVAD